MSTSHSFSFDWFSAHVPKFEKYLRPLQAGPCTVVEIGAHEGRSTTWLLENILTHESSRIVTIDVSVQPSFWRNVEASGGLQKTQLFVGLSGEILRRLPFASADFIYIDGSHGTPDVLEDAVLSFRVLKRGGIMAFDDYLWNEPKWGREGFPKPAIDAFLDAYKARVEVLEMTYQVWLRKLNEQPAPPNQPVST
jgi:predicted O-methyltransferase YrrM